MNYNSYISTLFNEKNSTVPLFISGNIEQIIVFRYVLNLPNDVLFSLLKYYTLHDNNASILTFQISRKSLLGGSKPIKKVFVLTIE